jgi:hypothetical protein
MSARSIIWRVLALAGLFGLAYLNEKYNLGNPELERKLVGCWAGTTGSGIIFSGAAVLTVDANGTFSERGIERTFKDPKNTKIVNASGTWKLQKNRWILSYDESTASFMFPRAGRSLNLVVQQVSEDTIKAKGDSSFSLPYNLGRVPCGSPLMVAHPPRLAVAALGHEL